MITRIIMASLLLASSLHTAAQIDESPAKRRYLNKIFDEVIFTGDIVYATKYNDLSNKREELKLRVFEPKGDTQAVRPLLLLTPGGGFVYEGDDWMNDVAEELAKAGYVVALNKYRLSSGIDSAEKYFKALQKTTTDQSDALRFLLKDAKARNRFRIDPKNVFIGGHSAGAITSMHTAYLDAEDSMNPHFRKDLLKNKALPERNEKFKLLGVINLAGLLTDLSIINHNDIPLLNIHGEKDGVVPADRDNRGFGSIAIHEYAQTVRTYSELYVIKGAKHNDTAIPALCEECVPLMKRFMFNRLSDTNRQ